MSFSVSGITGTSHTIDGMLPNTTYYWRVAAMTATSTGPWSSAWSFTTAGGTPPIGLLNGTIAYSNSALTPMNNCIVVVSDTNEVEIGRDTTDAAGNFSIPGAGTGIFFIEIFTNKAHGGVTIADVLLMRQSIAGLITLNGLETKAADININGTVNIQDVLPMRQKIANITPISSWLVPDYIYEITNINTVGTTTTLTIEALCGGDVNGSYTPPNN